MMTLLGIVDRKSILAYLGRPAYRSRQVVDHTKKWDKTGNSTPITHTFYKKLQAKKGYLELFGLGYVYTENNEWFIHWNHEMQLSLSESMNREVTNGIGKSSKQNISPPILATQHNTRNDAECERDGDIEREKRERVVKRERNCESESNQPIHGKDHAEKVKLNSLESAILHSHVVKEREA